MMNAYAIYRVCIFLDSLSFAHLGRFSLRRTVALLQTGGIVRSFHRISYPSVPFCPFYNYFFMIALIIVALGFICFAANIADGSSIYLDVAPGDGLEQVDSSLRLYKGLLKKGLEEHQELWLDIIEGDYHEEGSWGPRFHKAITTLMSVPTNYGHFYKEPVESSALIYLLFVPSFLVMVALVVYLVFNIICYW